MKRYTTPTIELRIEGEDLEDCDVYVTLAQGAKKITVTGDELTLLDVDSTGMTAKLVLTQEQTAGFRTDSSVMVQANVIDSTGHRSATGIKKVNVWNNLLDKVIEYQGQSKDAEEAGDGTH